MCVYNVLTCSGIVQSILWVGSMGNVCHNKINLFLMMDLCVLLLTQKEASSILQITHLFLLPGSLKEKVHSTWVQGVQTLVKQTGALLTEHGLLMKIVQWIKHTINDKEGNMHQ